jgi:4-hydroxy-tetrahydrodipicolinate synthase
MASSFEGVYAAALTPLRDDLAIDRRAYAEHCRRLLDEGCDGLAIFGTTGEANSFSVCERVGAWEALVADGIPADALLPGTGACALTDAVTLTREALAVGAPGVLALPPFYYKGVSDDGLFAFFAELIERVGDDRLRLFLYHIPPQTVLGFSFALIERLLDAYPSVIAGTKDSSGDARRIEALCRAFPPLRVFAGTEALLLDTLRWGGAGCISATVNVTAALSAEVFRTRSEEAQTRLTARREYLERFPAVPALKAILRSRTGEDSWHVRPPLVPLDDARAGELLAGLETN